MSPQNEGEIRDDWSRPLLHLGTFPLMQLIAAQKGGFFMSKEQSVRRMIIAAFFVALSIVLTRMLSINTPFFRIGFGAVPIMIAGIVMGPQYGFIVGAVADLVGYMINPMGSFMPGFTLTSALTGAIPALLWQATESRMLILEKRTFWISLLVLVAGVTLSILRVGALSWEHGQLMAGEVGISLVHVAAAVLVFMALVAFTLVQMNRQEGGYRFGRILFVVLVTNIICSIGLNTLWLSLLFGKGFLALLPARLVVNLITIPVHTIIIFHLSRTFEIFER
jgi:ECF transporter S component (folate family)